MPSTSPKRTRKSPIKAPPLRMPGQSVRDQLDSLRDDTLSSWCIPPVLVWFLALVMWIHWLTRTPITLVWCIGWTAVAAAFSLLAVLKVRRILPHVRNLRQGSEGELVVGQFLDEYCRERGYKVLHDLKGNSFNVDHVLIGRGGIFALETKTISKPVVGEPIVTYDGDCVLVDGYTPDRNPVDQAKACARHVAELLAQSTNRPVSQIPVRPVVLYPGWFIEGSSSGRDAWVLNPKVLLSFLDHEPDRLSREDVGLFHFHLTTHIRAKERSG